MTTSGIRSNLDTTQEQRNDDNQQQLHNNLTTRWTTTDENMKQVVDNSQLMYTKASTCKILSHQRQPYQVFLTIRKATCSRSSRAKAFDFFSVETIAQSLTFYPDRIQTQLGTIHLTSSFAYTVYDAGPPTRTRPPS